MESSSRSPLTATPPTVRMEPRILLEAETRLGETPTQATDQIERTNEPAPAGRYPTVPGYEIIHLLGRGGMGQVFLARDLKLHRQVALKMLLGWAAEDGHLFQRFQNEIQAVAKLQHPNIAQVYETGEAGGLPFFTMEYVAGGTLAERIARQPLPTREAAELIETLARTMQFAHERGVLHRDLKPANVLVGTRQEAMGSSSSDGRSSAYCLLPRACKIADFGLAKQTDQQNRQTKTGDILGTPGYMAPEQASGLTREFGPTVDVYALGAILYELLTGRPPFHGPEPFQVVMEVLTTEPVAPRSLAPRVERDLETICLKCLAKSPAKRFPTAAALADDLRRFLDGQPIEARPTPWWERVLKWLRRHPVWAVLFLVSLFLTGFFGWGYYSVSKAYSEREASLWVAQEAVNRMLTRTAEELKDVPQTEDLRRSILEDAAILFRALLKVKPSDDKSQEMSAQARFRLGQIYRQQGKLEEADALYRQAQRQYEQLLDRWPNQSEYSAGLANVHHGLGQLRDDQGKPDKGATEYRRELELLSAISSPDFEVRIARSRCLNNLAVQLNSQGRKDEAAKLHEQALKLRQALHEERPDDPKIRSDLASSHINVAGLLVGTGRISEELQHAHAAEELMQPLVARLTPDQRLQLGQIQNNLGGCLERQSYPNGNLKQPEAVDKEIARQSAEKYQAALATLRSLSQDFPGSVTYRFTLARTLMNAALQQGRLFNDAGALAYFQEAELELLRLSKDFPDRPAFQKALSDCRRILRSFEGVEIKPASAPTGTKGK